MNLVNQLILLMNILPLFFLNNFFDNFENKMSKKLDPKETQPKQIKSKKKPKKIKQRKPKSLEPSNTKFTEFDNPITLLSGNFGSTQQCFHATNHERHKLMNDVPEQKDGKSNNDLATNQTYGYCKEYLDRFRESITGAFGLGRGMIHMRLWFNIMHIYIREIPESNGLIHPFIILIAYHNNKYVDIKNANKVYPERPMCFILDRINGIRFSPVKVDEWELVKSKCKLCGQISAKEELYYERIKALIDTQRVLDKVKVNQKTSITFIWNFFAQALPKHLKSMNQKEFEDRLLKDQAIFPISDVNELSIKGQYSNKEFKRELLFQRNIEWKDSKKGRDKWKKGKRICFKCPNVDGRHNWFIGVITKIDKNSNDVEVGYLKMNCVLWVKTNIDSSYLKPFIIIPNKYLDAFTRKVMTKPVQILRSGITYDEITVKYWQSTKLGIDPTIGVPITISGTNILLYIS